MRLHAPIGFPAIRVLDGGMATELERRGCDLSGALWSAHVLDTSPETIAAVHLDYLRAGADCIATASYQVSAQGYREVGRDAAEAERALRQAVELAERARAEYAREDARRIWIAASLGPYGAALHNGAEYHGRYEIGFEALVRFHAERLTVLAQTEVDLVAFETIPSREEVRAIERALEQTPAVRAWISLTCGDEVHVAHGETLRACAEEADASPQVLAVGINCTPPRWIAALIGEAQKGTGKPVVVYPNSGETWDAAGRRWQGTADVAHYAQMAREWFGEGAQAVGGCCRTGPEHIRAVAEVVRLGRSGEPS